MKKLSPLLSDIDPAVLRLVEEDMRSAGTLINHLQQRLGEQTTEVWEKMAQASGRRFIATPAEAGPIDARLLTQNDALDYLVLPRVRSFTTISLMTPDPFAKLSDVTALKARFAPLVPGGEASIRLDVTTPACFRELFNLIYPEAWRSYRDTADAAVLAALLPRLAWAEHRPTPEEEAEARATFRGLRFIDPLLEKQEEFTDEFAEIFTARRLYPHSRNEGGHLTVLGALIGDEEEELKALRQRVDNLSLALNQPLHLALTSPRRLIQLL